MMNQENMADASFISTIENPRDPESIRAAMRDALDRATGLFAPGILSHTYIAINADRDGYPALNDEGVVLLNQTPAELTRNNAATVAAKIKIPEVADVEPKEVIVMLKAAA